MQGSEQVNDDPVQVDPHDPRAQGTGNARRGALCREAAGEKQMVLPDFLHVPVPMGRGERVAVQRAGYRPQIQPAGLVLFQGVIPAQDVVHLPIPAMDVDSLYGASIIGDLNIVVGVVRDPEDGHLRPVDCPKVSRHNLLLHWYTHSFLSL